MILLDTHVLIWVEMMPEELSALAREAIEEADRSGETIAISSVTLWEITQLAHRGRIALSIPLEHFLTEISATYEVLPISAKTAIHAAALPEPFPKDPMDRLIAGSAIALGATLLTRDSRIHEAKACKLLW